MTRDELVEEIITIERHRDEFSVGSPSRDVFTRVANRIQAELDRLNGPSPGFVRVRVGVAVDRHGLWVAAGGHRVDDEAIVRRELLAGPGDSISWITADVPLPRVVEVKGKVEK